jgi:hypothetical protein
VLLTTSPWVGLVQIQLGPKLQLQSGTFASVYDLPRPFMAEEVVSCVPQACSWPFFHGLADPA